ncbi:MAG: glycosyltransferase [Candidatus Moranbacteria bacterium]|nr:glycosyltransferase [Candidatus Moranbacteria bacterium]
MPQISIIIINYNSLNHLKRLLKNLTPHPKIELIIIDNGEFKNQKRINIKKKLQRGFFIQNKKNLGFAAACNQGAELAKGRSLLFINPDCQIQTKDIFKLEKILFKHKKTAVAIPKIIKLPVGARSLLEPATPAKNGEKNREEFSCQERELEQKHAFAQKKDQITWFTGACFLIKSRIFKKLKGFDENFFMYFEDKDLSKRILKAGYTIKRNPKIKVIHFESQSRISWPKRKELYYKAQDYYNKKYFGLIYMLVFKFIRFPLYFKNVYLNKKTKLILTLLILSPLIILLELKLSLYFLSFILGLILLFFAFHNLEKTLILFIFLLPFLPALNLSSSIDMASARIFVILIFSLWLVKSLINKNLFIPINKTSLFIILFLLYCFLSIFFSSTPERGLRKTLVFLNFFPLYFIVFSMLKNQKKLLIKLLKALSLATGVLAGLSLIQFLSQFIFGHTFLINFYSEFLGKFFWGANTAQSVSENPSWFFNAGGLDLMRTFATLPDPHMLSYFLCFGLPIQIFFAIKSFKKLSQKQNKKEYPGFFLIIFLICLSLITEFLTFSRGGYLGFLGGLTAFAFFIFKQNKNQLKKLNQKIKKIKIALTILTLTALIALILIENPITDRLYSSFDLSEGSNLARLEIWQKSLNLFFKKPITGHGLGSYSFEIQPSADYRSPVNAHNIYLEFLTEIGLIGALLFLMILLSSFKTNLKIINLNKQKNGHLEWLSPVICFSLIWFFIHSFFEQPMYSPVILPLLVIFISLTSWLDFRYKKNNN